MAHIKTLIMTAALAGIGAGLSGCAGISKDECLAGNWDDMGYRDGVNGESRGLLADYANICSGHGAGVDRGAYLQSYETGLNEFCAPLKGYDQGRRGSAMPGVCSSRPEYRAQYDLGVSQYCTPDSGYERGLAGKSANQVCGAPQYNDYRAGYYDGRAIYDAEQERLRAVEYEHDRLHDAVVDTERAVRDVRNRLESDALSDSERYRLKKKLGRLEDRRRYQIKELRVFERGNGLDYCY